MHSFVTEAAKPLAQLDVISVAPYNEKNQHNEKNQPFGDLCGCP